MTYALLTTRLAPLTLTVALVALSAGCDTPPIVPPHDGGNDGGFTLPDGVVPCTTDVDCDDHIACTRDTCLAGVMVCGHTGDDTVCDDDIFCNGMEVCDFAMGCIAVRTHETCDDGDVCTLDHCVEATKTCEHGPRDLDQDGDPDQFCDGTDCADRDPTRSGLIREVCDDGEDNDCDGTVDEGGRPDGGGADAGPFDAGPGGGCGRPDHDTCADPLEITASGTTDLFLDGASPDYTLSCFGTPRPDLVLSLTLTEAHDVNINGVGDLVGVALSMRSTCTDASTQTDCHYGYPASIRRRNLPAGTYYVIVQGSGEVLVDVELLPPTTTPSNESCSAPIVIPASGGHYDGNFVDLANDVTLSCGFGANPDLVYQVDIAAESDVTVSLSTVDGQQMSWELRPNCAATSPTVRCVQGSPAYSTLHQVQPGTYFLIIEGPSYVEVDYTLDVIIGPPTPRVHGDLCTDPIALTLGTPYHGTITGAEDDLTISCGFGSYRDVMHQFTVTAPSDLAITVDGSTRTMFASLRSTTCDTGGTQVRCASGAPLSMHVRSVMPGTYYLVVESFSTGAYTVTVDATTPPTVPTPAVGNDNCGNPVIIPATGGFWSGDTSTFVQDYDPRTGTCGTGQPASDVAFRLDLATRSRVVATTEGSSFDTLLYRMTGTCRTMGETICDDDGGGSGNTSQLSEMLDPGTYFYIIDGFSTTARGPYEFQVFVSPAP